MPSCGPKMRSAASYGLLGIYPYPPYADQSGGISEKSMPAINDPVWKINQKVKPAEFENPDLMSRDLVLGLMETRDWLGQPMWFSKHNDTRYHPNGDAVLSGASSHSKASLHKAGINHNESDRTGEIVYDDGQLGLAQDWDCNSPSVEHLWETYLMIERLNIWNGIGLYPNWRRKGLHTDIRNVAHAKSRARWFRVDVPIPGSPEIHSTYYPLTWSNWKREAVGL